MNHPFKSKGIFLWETASVLKGDPEAIAEALMLAGFESVYVKAADGATAFYSGGKANISSALVDACHRRNIAVVGWSFNYGYDPKGEGQVAADLVNRWGLDGYIWDVEGAFEKWGDAVQRARDLTGSFRSRLVRQVPTALCSWAFYKNPLSGSSWHPLNVAAAFLESCEFLMPMEYWQSYSTPAQYLRNSITQLRTILPPKEIVPVGRAYNGDGGTGSASGITEFAVEAQLLGVSGISWWGLDWAIKTPDWWEALKKVSAYGMGVKPADVPPERTELLLTENWGTATYRKERRFTDRDVLAHILTIPVKDYDILFDDRVWPAYTTTFVDRKGVDFAINGLDGWETVLYRKKFPVTSLQGFAASKGKQFGRLGREQTLFISQEKTFSLEKPRVIWDACSFPNLLVEKGEVVDLKRFAETDIRARTAFGVNQVQDTMVVVCVDGADWGSSSWAYEGMNFQQTAALMKELGCDLAVMSDGGGSTTLVRNSPEGPVIINKPCGDSKEHGNQRAVAIHMGFRRING